MLERTSGGRSHRVSTTGNLQQSMRTNYGEHGVDKYYKQVRTCDEEANKRCLILHWRLARPIVIRTSPASVHACLPGWKGGGLTRKGLSGPDHLSSLTWLAVTNSLLCAISATQGTSNHQRSGEVTVAAYEWWKRGISGMQPSENGIARQKHDSLSTKTDGLEGKSSTPVTRRVPDDLLITAADPYTQAAYAERTTLPCTPLTFREISEGLLPSVVSTATAIGVSRACNVDASIDKIDMVVCSFALHLVESSSELFALLRELSTRALWLVVLAPHKKPEIKEGWGWVKWDSESWSECGMRDRREFILERVHCRVYRSINVLDPGYEVAESGE